jgi:hypothetical protein
MSRIEQLFMRFVLLFLRVERTECDDPKCHCKNHEVVVPTRLAWYAALAVTVLQILWMRSLR